MFVLHSEELGSMGRCPQWCELCHYEGLCGTLQKRETKGSCEFYLKIREGQCYIDANRVKPAWLGTHLGQFLGVPFNARICPCGKEIFLAVGCSGEYLFERYVEKGQLSPLPAA
jgi:hypothetical protein